MYVPVARCGKTFVSGRKTVFKGKQIFSEKFFQTRHDVFAYNRINLFAVSLPDKPYVLLDSVAHYFYEFSQLNRSYLLTLKLEVEDNDDK